MFGDEEPALSEMPNLAAMFRATSTLTPGPKQKVGHNKTCPCGSGGAGNFSLMLQRLLTERLGLVVHRESKEQPVYDLVVSKGGLKMQAAAPAAAGVAPPDPDAPSPGGQAPRIQFIKDKDGKSQLPAGRALNPGAADATTGAPAEASTTAAPL